MLIKNGSIQLVDRKILCKILGGVSISHIIRLEQSGNLSEAKVKVGDRAVRYDLKRIEELISARALV